MHHFREIKPVRYGYRVKNSAETIKICFSYWGHVKSGLVIYIGKQILRNLGMAENARIRFFVDDEKPRQWFIKKSEDKQGYQLTRASTHYVKCQITWREDIPHTLESAARLVNFQISAGGLYINAEFQQGISAAVEEVSINPCQLVLAPGLAECPLP